MIDDNESRILPAKKTGVKVSHYKPYAGDESGEQLLDESSKLIKESIEEVNQKQ